MGLSLFKLIWWISKTPLHLKLSWSVMTRLDKIWKARDDTDRRSDSILILTDSLVVDYFTTGAKSLMATSKQNNFILKWTPTSLFLTFYFAGSYLIRIFDKNHLYSNIAHTWDMHSSTQDTLLFFRLTVARNHSRQPINSTLPPLLAWTRHAISFYCFYYRTWSSYKHHE